MGQKVYYVGSHDEVAHHARPLQKIRDVEIIDPDRVVEVATSNDLAIFFSEHFHRFRTAIEGLKQRGCRTLYAIDGILEWRNAFENRADEPACPWTMRPVLSHKVATIGRSQARQLCFWGNAKKVEVIGLPRFDELVVARDSNLDKLQTSPSTSETQCPKSGMVMTAKWPAFTDEQLANVEQSLIDIKSWVQNHDINVVWRLTGDLEKKLKITNALSSVNGIELVDQLQQCDFLVTTPSTAMLEGMLLSKPTAILEYNDCPELTQSAWRINSPNQVGFVLNELMNPCPRKLAQQEFILHDALECTGSATERLDDLIDRMLACDAEELGPNLVPLNNDDEKHYPDTNFLFNQVQLFESNSQLELKSHAAQLERDIDRLESRNEILEREFMNAQNALAKFMNNPMISPIVKAGNIASKIFGKTTT